MIKKLVIITIIICLISCCGIVSAENDTIGCLEGGDSNITFDGGYKGYCAEWGEHSAEEGQIFMVENTSMVDNSNYLKSMFVFFYNQTQKDVYATQHMIWKFTDNKQFSRFNQTWYNQIVGMGDKYTIPDSFRMPVNDTHQWGFDFRVFVPFDDTFQKFFGYRFITDEIPKNSTIDINNSTTNNSTIIVPEHQNNITFDEFNDSSDLSNQIYDDDYISNIQNIDVSKQTGMELWTLGCIIILCIILIILKFN